MKTPAINKKKIMLNGYSSPGKNPSKLTVESILAISFPKLIQQDGTYQEKRNQTCQMNACPTARSSAIGSVTAAATLLRHWRFPLEHGFSEDDGRPTRSDCRRCPPPRYPPLAISARIDCQQPRSTAAPQTIRSQCLSALHRSGEHRQPWSTGSTRA